MREKSSLTYIEALIAASVVVYLAWDLSWGLPPGGVAVMLGVIVYFGYLLLMRRWVRLHQKSYEGISTILALAWGALAYFGTVALQAAFASQIPDLLLMHLWPWIAAALAFIGAIASKVHFIDDVRAHVVSRRARWQDDRRLEQSAGF